MTLPAIHFAALIFDFNGVLWWDAPLIDRGWQRSARELRGREFAPEELAQIVHGRNNGGTLEYLVGHPLGVEEIRRMIDERETYYCNLCLEQGEAFRLSPGAVELPPPTLGQHTEEILKELGYSVETIEGLRREKVI